MTLEKFTFTGMINIIIKNNCLFLKKENHFIQVCKGEKYSTIYILITKKTQ